VKKSKAYPLKTGDFSKQNPFKIQRKRKPAIGKIDEIETIPEVKVEMICHKDKIKEVVTSMKNTHPYESVAYSVVRMEDI